MTAYKRTPKPKKPRVAKTRASNTMTEAAFWSYIRSALRNKSRYWPPIKQVKQASRRPYKGENKRQKFEYQCNLCKEWYAEKHINVDHIVGAGALNCYNDLPGFVERLFCEADNLQVLCESCHNQKTQQEKNGISTI